MSGNGYITDHDIYKENVSDVSLLAGSVASHARVFGKKFKSGAADRAFMTKSLSKISRKNIKYPLLFPIKKTEEG